MGNDTPDAAETTARAACGCCCCRAVCTNPPPADKRPDRCRAAAIATALRTAASQPLTPFGLRHLQTHLPWTIPYSAEFETSANANPRRRVVHDILHVLKALGRVAADCEHADHGRPTTMTPEAMAREVADLVTCALHIARVVGFDLQDAVVGGLERRNGVTIPGEAAAHQRADRLAELEEEVRGLRELAWDAGRRQIMAWVVARDTDESCTRRVAIEAARAETAEAAHATAQAEVERLRAVVAAWRKAMEDVHWREHLARGCTFPDCATRKSIEACAALLRDAPTPETVKS